MVELPHSQKNAVAVVLLVAAPLDPFEVSSIDVDPVWRFYSFADRFLRSDDRTAVGWMSAEVLLV